MIKELAGVFVFGDVRVSNPPNARATQPSVCLSSKRLHAVQP
jgi:hypothetical protein